MKNNLDDFIDQTIIFFEAYSKKKEPIEVNFRELVNSIKFQDRATHQVHTYPAKLLPNIPYYFLNNSFFTENNDNILDPFCGSGTVLLEAILANKNAFGCDANPLARLISTVKTSKYNIETLKQVSSSLREAIDLDPIKDYDKIIIPEVINIDYWFLPEIKYQLANVLDKIKGISDENYRNFFLLCFSNCVKKVSLADPRVSVPVKIKLKTKEYSHPFVKESKSKIKKLESLDVKKYFFEIIDDNLKKIHNKQSLHIGDNIATVISNDARFTNLSDNTIDLIISSPPYAGAQKYIRASSLNLGWTELSTIDNLKELDKKNIGRENYSKSEYINLKTTGIEDADILLKEIFLLNPIRAHIAGNYLLEMQQAIKECSRVLKPNKFFVMIAANNQVCGKEFKTQEFLRQIAEKAGLETKCVLIDDIKSYGLMTKRNKTASIITREWVLILQKNERKITK